MDLIGARIGRHRPRCGLAPPRFRGDFVRDGCYGCSDAATADICALLAGWLSKDDLYRSAFLRISADERNAYIDLVSRLWVRCERSGSWMVVGAARSLDLETVCMRGPRSLVISVDL